MIFIGKQVQQGGHGSKLFALKNSSRLIYKASEGIIFKVERWRNHLESKV